MIHTVKINDETSKGKRIIDDLRNYPKEVQFENTTNQEIREGYYTLEEFRKIAIEKGQKFCDKHGII